MRLTEGPIGPALMRLAWPVFVSRALHTLYATADTIWVGRLGPEALAAVSTCFFASWILYAVGDVLIAGVTALVARAVGAERDDDARVASATAYVLALGLGCVVAAIGAWGSAPLFRLLFDDPEIVRMGSVYLARFSLVAPILYVSVVAESVFRSCGDSRTPMNVVLIGTALNVVLDPFLIFGIGPFPRLEVEGAAIASVISEGVVLGLFGVLYLRGRFPLGAGASLPRSTFSREKAIRIFRIGMPHAAIGVLFSVVYLILARFAGAFGAPALAALGVVNRLESLNYLTATAVGMGVSTLVGQNLGAGLPDRAELSAHRGAQLLTVTTGIVTVVFLVFAEPIVRLFTSDPVAIVEGARFLRIVAISQVFMGWEIVYGHAFTGAGNTLPPMIISVVVSVLRIPMAWWLAFPAGAGPNGIWWTISATGIIRGLVLPWWFRRGGWKHTDVGVDAREPDVVAPLAGPDSPEG